MIEIFVLCLAGGALTQLARRRGGHAWPWVLAMVVGYLRVNRAVTVLWRPGPGLIAGMAFVALLFPALYLVVGRGRRARRPWQCPNCQFFNEPSTLVCPCGHRLDDEDGATQALPPEAIATGPGPDPARRAVIVRNVSIGCGLAVVAALGVIAILWGQYSLRQRRWNEVAQPFLAQFVRDLARWDPGYLEPYWATQARDQLASPLAARVFAAYRRLGALESHEAPRFVNLGVHQQIPYPEIVTYLIDARYENGPAQIAVALVQEPAGELRVWHLNITAEALLPDAETGPDTGGAVPAVPRSEPK